MMDLRTQTELTLWQPGSHRRKGHLESYFLRLNDPGQNLALWLKWTVYAPIGPEDRTVVETWGIFFDGADASRSKGWKEVAPIEGAEFARDRFHVRFGPSVLEEGHTTGLLKGEAGTLTWDLSFTPGEEPLIPFPMPWMYTGKFPKSKTKTPHPASRFSGTFTIDDRTYTVSNVPGMQGHNWGTEHSYLYSWGHCSAFEDHGDDTWFEGFSSRLKIGPWVTPYLSMGFLSLRGERYAFNSVGSLLRSEVESGTTWWNFTIPGRDHSLRGRVQAPKERFLGLHYYNPDGAVRYCLNSKMADGQIELLDRSGAVLATLVSKGTFALENLVHDPSHGVRMVA